MRGNMFIKVFLGFWLITIVVIGSIMLLTRYLDTLPLENASLELERYPEPERPRPGSNDPYGKKPPRDSTAPEWRRPGPERSGQGRPSPPPAMMLRLIYSLQNTALEDLPAVASSASERHNMTLYLLDKEGQDLLGQDPPPVVLRAANLLDKGRRRAFTRVGDTQYAIHSIYRRDTGPLRAVVVWEKNRPLLDALGSSPLLRLLLAVVVSGLLCLALSRVVTRRIKEVQQATRKLAQGDLDTRIAVKASGGDETDGLARDFNTMADELQQLIQAQRRLLQDVSHELRSPLARLRIALALAQDKPEDIDAQLQRIEKETEQLDRLIGQLLSSQVQKITLDSHIDLVALLEEICNDGALEADVKGQSLVFECDLEHAVIVTSGDLLHSTFENLARNAMRHSPVGAAVRVGLKASDARFVITVNDQGPGVPEEQLDAIFQPFYRVDSDRDRQSGGHGLGLAIAQRAVALHGGDISAENTDPGLRVTVELPRGDTESTSH